MKALEIQANGLEHLHFAERPMPTPKPGEVVVRMRAGSLNYRDLVTVMGTAGRDKLPLVPLSCGSGEVSVVGEGVSRVKIGDQVVPLFYQGWFTGPMQIDSQELSLGGTLDGVAQQYICLSEQGVVRIPPGTLSHEEAATLACAGLTAWRAVFFETRMVPGESVLIQGTGGVSIFALQFAKAAGARIIVTSSSDDKLERARKLGADETINYKRTPDWATEARKLTDGEGVDHVIEVGGAGTFEQSMKAAKLGGRIGVVGLLGGVIKDLSVVTMFYQNLQIRGVTVGNRTHFEEMLRGIIVNKIEPVIDKRLPLSEMREGLELLRDGKHFGKIVLTID